MANVCPTTDLTYLWHSIFSVWPQLVTPNPEMKKLVEGIHEVLGNTLYFLIGAHALAALWQHYVVKGETLRRMLNKVKAQA